MTFEEQVELQNLNLILSDKFISNRIPDKVLKTILKRYSELVDKLLNKYELLTNLDTGSLLN